MVPVEGTEGAIRRRRADVASRPREETFGRLTNVVGKETTWGVGRRVVVTVEEKVCAWQAAQTLFNTEMVRDRTSL